MEEAIGHIIPSNRYIDRNDILNLSISKHLFTETILC